ncbi:MAG: amidohydrolase family protein, partial [Acidobacteriota bacterium]
ADVVAVLLPLASLYLGQPAANARRLIDSEVKVAVSTDFNPGSSPNFHLPLALTLACSLCRMSPAEALKGATIYAAQAVDLQDGLGSLEVGKAADFAIIDAEDPNDWLYRFRPNACVATFIGGESVFTADEVI